MLNGAAGHAGRDACDQVMKDGLALLARLKWGIAWLLQFVWKARTGDSYTLRKRWDLRMGKSREIVHQHSRTEDSPIILHLFWELVLFIYGKTYISDVYTREDWDFKENILDEITCYMIPKENWLVTEIFPTLTSIFLCMDKMVVKWYEHKDQNEAPYPGMSV